EVAIELTKLIRCISGFFFFFSSRRRHTRCYRDWSSDVCSSDLSPNHTVTRAGRGSLCPRGQARPLPLIYTGTTAAPLRTASIPRSEERRVGKECRSLCAQYP